MKTKAMKKILSMLLVCVMLVGALAGFNVFAAEDPTIEIVSTNVWYGAAYYPMFAVKTSAAEDEFEVSISTDEGAVEAIYRGTETVKDYGTCYVYVANQGVTAQDIDVEYTITAKISEDVKATASISVLEYLNTRLYVTGKDTVDDEDDDPSEEEKAMYNALIDYAIAAEKFFDKGVSAIESLYYVNVEGDVANTGMYNTGYLVELTTDLVAGDGEKIVWTITDLDTKLEETSEDNTYTVKTANVMITAEVVAEDYVEPQWTLVTDASSLKAGDQIVIVAADSAVALSTTQNSNNRGQATVVKDGNTVTFGADVQIITLEDGTAADTLAFNVGGGYLYAAGGTKDNNYLKTSANKTLAASWRIAISDGVATIITADTTVVKNQLQKNSSSALFSCYSTTQKSVSIYKLG